MRNLRIFTLILLATLFSSACEMKGYEIYLRVEHPDLTISRVIEILLENGFEKYEGETQYQIARFRKKPPEIRLGFFDRNEDYMVRVDINRKQQGNEPTGESFEVIIHNRLVGNHPEFKPIMTKTADFIENAIKKTAPDIKVQRSERLTGIPFI